MSLVPTSANAILLVAGSVPVLLSMALPCLQTQTGNEGHDEAQPAKRPRNKFKAAQDRHRDASSGAFSYA